jgi:hypothetical protein
MRYALAHVDARGCFAAPLEPSRALALPLARGDVHASLLPPRDAAALTAAPLQALYAEALRAAAELEVEGAGAGEGEGEGAGQGEGLDAPRLRSVAEQLVACLRSRLLTQRGTRRFLAFSVESGAQAMSVESLAALQFLRAGDLSGEELRELEQSASLLATSGGLRSVSEGLTAFDVDACPADSAAVSLDATAAPCEVRPLENALIAAAATRLGLRELAAAAQRAGATVASLGRHLFAEALMARRSAKPSSAPQWRVAGNVLSLGSVAAFAYFETTRPRASATSRVLPSDIIALPERAPRCNSSASCCAALPRLSRGWGAEAAQCAFASDASAPLTPTLSDASLHARLDRQADLGAAPAASGVTFRCGAGEEATVIPLELVNDDFCDCPDGADEPGTSACAGRARGDRSRFRCANGVGDVALAMVGDGICDCADGSDEPAGCGRT